MKPWLTSMYLVWIWWMKHPRTSKYFLIQNTEVGCTNIGVRTHLLLHNSLLPRFRRDLYPRRKKSCRKEKTVLNKEIGASVFFFSHSLLVLLSQSRGRCSWSPVLEESPPIPQSASMVRLFGSASCYGVSSIERGLKFLVKEVLLLGKLANLVS